ncbi:allophanate hydrolase subunit 2-domain-containing protein, partial [Infundibulicybe gibba]
MYQGHKLLIANRGEIAVRILRTAKELGLPTVTIYTPSDSLSPHVTLADEAGEAQWYLSSAMILYVCQMKGVTLLHPGYGFSSENAEFAAQVVEAGIIWLGPRPETIKAMGLKHTARSIARQAGLELVPGSEGLVHDVEQASLLSQAVGFPIMLKATAGGGGMGMVVCHSESELRREFGSIRQRAKTLFNDDGVFLERFFPSARHIEVQVSMRLGDLWKGLGDVVHMGERECSIQRRHQKIIEETPSPFLISRPEFRNSMCLSAVKLCRSINYASAGTVDFYFLEMNTRIQVEHPITEQIYPGLDISDSLAMQQKTYDLLRQHGAEMGHVHSIEGRIYAENPIEDFLPSPGILTYVNLHSGDYDWLRIETWISTGLNITPFFDPLLAKLIVSGTTREEAIGRFLVALDECQILGPPNNVEYLKSITADSTFRSGRATTSFLSQFPFVPNAITVLSAGIDATVQDLPGRTVGLGVPRSGPMDSLAFRVCNKLVGNREAVEALEIIVVHGVYFAVKFWVSAVVAITGIDVLVTVDGRIVDAWARIVIPSGAILRLEAKSDSSGCRSYLAVRGGFPGIPAYLGSKSTSMGFGGYKSLRAQDQLSLADVPPRAVPRYPSHWEIHVLPGPQDDDEFVTAKGIAKFYSSAWRISSSSNRMGIRLESLDDQPIQWARKSGGQGGSHPSNILDNGYSPGSININGDTPVILTCEGPDMGGYLCFVLWKLGQLSPGSTVSFRRINWDVALQLHRQLEGLPSNGPNVSPLELPIDTGVDKTTPKPTVLHHITQSGGGARPTVLLRRVLQRMIPNSSLLHRIVQSGDNARPAVVFRQAGDSAILVEFGPMNLDFAIRVRLHVFEKEIRRMEIRGSKNISACVRSLLYQYDPLIISQAEALVALQRAERLIPTSVIDLKLPGRRFTFPIVLDDSWSRNALERYMQTTRKTAVYLPSNIEYLAKNNGLRGGSKEALDKLIGTDWVGHLAIRSQRG